jgi:hypothetical protein
MSANIISAIQNLKMAQEQFEDFCRQFPDTKGEKLFKVYVGKINWMFNDIVTHPFLTDQVRSGIKKEINSDIFAIPAIQEKIALLNPEQREMIEATLDAMIDGEEVKIVDIKHLNDGG